jgi:hypothetical protein
MRIVKFCLSIYDVEILDFLGIPETMIFSAPTTCGGEYHPAPIGSAS